MDYPDYLTNRDKIFEYYFSGDNFSVWNDESIMGNYNLVSASLHNYLPDINYDEHERIFRDIMLNQQMSILEQNVPEILKNVEFEGLTNDKLDILKHQAAIICTFHTGSYRAINHFLFQNGINFSIVVAKSVFETQAKDFENIHQNFYLHKTSEFKVIDAENPRSLFQMIRELKERRVLVFYIDGNTGAEIKDEEKNNLCDIQFLHQRIFARKGRAYLSYITDTPILTVGCYRKTLDDIRLVFHDLIYSNKQMNREEYTIQTTQQMFNFIMLIIEKYPEQWEGWLYLYKSINLVNKFKTPEKADVIINEGELNEVRFNKAEFGICRISDQTYLFKKENFSFFPIEEDLYKLLYKGIFKPILKEEFDINIFSQLYENNALIHV